jgi:hypothetical protein
VQSLPPLLLPLPPPSPKLPLLLPPEPLPLLSPRRLPASPLAKPSSLEDLPLQAMTTAAIEHAPRHFHPARMPEN